MKKNGFVGMVFLIIFGVFAGMFALAAIGSFLGFITIPWFKFDKRVQMERGIIDKTYDANNALYNYHWFKERAEAIKALQNIIGQSKAQVTAFSTAAGERKGWTWDDRQEYARLNAVVQGQQAQLENLVAEYNARAKEVDRAIFKDDLPLFFTLEI